MLPGDFSSFLNVLQEGLMEILTLTRQLEHCINYMTIQTWHECSIRSANQSMLAHSTDNKKLNE